MFLKIFDFLSDHTLSSSDVLFVLFYSCMDYNDLGHRVQSSYFVTEFIKSDQDRPLKFQRISVRM